ncbi:MAG: DUF1684 domain-containing protein [Bacteroidetes bacterium]|nr:DUF1684 domain-containing protein [Bacteroidota bacterium]
MKNFTVIVLILLFAGSCKKQEEKYTNLHQITVEKHQEKLNAQYADSLSSPLKQDDRLSFEKLDFFPINESYKVEATLKLTPNDPVFEMKTTTDRKPLYKRYGVALFTLNEKEYRLNVYQNQELILDFEHRDYLFLPFTDETNGAESYKGGRYIDARIPKDSILSIDFNLAYNPYCAYNSKYSCPVVPKENHLPLKIYAGVKKFDKH